MNENFEKMKNESDGNKNLWTDEFVDNLKSVRNASRYSRIVIFALLTFTLSNLIILVNAHEQAWTKQRISMVKEALTRNCKDNFRAEALKTIIDSSKHDSLKTKLESIAIDSVAWTAAYANDREFMNCADLYMHYQALMKMFNEDILLIRIPFIRTSIDSNWAVVISSIGLGLLLGALVKTLQREKKILEIANNKEIYKRAYLENFFPKWTAIAAIWLPIMVSLMVYKNDWDTIIYGQDIASSLSKFTSILGGIGVAICIIIAIFATRLLGPLARIRRSGIDSL